MKKNLTLGAMGLVTIAVVTAFGWTHFNATKTQAAPNPVTTVAVPINSTVPVPGSVDPSAQWLADFDRLNDLNTSLAAKRIDGLTRYLTAIADEKDPTQRALDQYQLENDLIVGLNNRLGSQIPQGFTWDSASRKFIPVPKNNKETVPVKK